MRELPFRRSLLPDGAHVLCAVSGGADSMCLLMRLLEEGSRIRVSCAHYNHTLRGEESDRDEAFVRGFCAARDIPFYAGQGDVRRYAAEKGLSLETAARELRYAFLQSCAAACNADRIATAHTADDNAETLLLHLARGTGAAGLSGIPERRGNIVRPLLSATREQVERYLAACGVGHVEDSTNGMDDAARNRIRHYAVPALRSVNPSFADAALRTAEALRLDEECLSSMAEREFARLFFDGAVDIPALLALPEAIARRVLRKAAGERAGSVHITALLGLCRSGDPSGELQLPGLTVRREYGRLLFSAGAEVTPIEPRELVIGVSLAVPEAGVRIESRLVGSDEKVQSSFNTFLFSFGKICGKIFVTSRMDGDKLVILGREGTRSVKKLLCDAKIPQRERSRIPIVRDAAGVLAVSGFGQAERAFPDKDDPAPRVMIQIISEEKRQ